MNFKFTICCRHLISYSLITIIVNSTFLENLQSLIEIEKLHVQGIAEGHGTSCKGQFFKHIFAK